jgi:hypothetical protein
MERVIVAKTTIDDNSHNHHNYNGKGLRALAHLSHTGLGGRCPGRRCCNSFCALCGVILAGGRSTLDLLDARGHVFAPFAAFLLAPVCALARLPLVRPVAAVADAVVDKHCRHSLATETGVGAEILASLTRSCASISTKA